MLFTGGGGAAFPDGEMGRPLLSSWADGTSSVRPDLSDFGIGRTALAVVFGSAEASAGAETEPFASSFAAFFFVSAGMNRGLVGRDEAATLAAEAGGGVEPDADVLAEERAGEFLETVTGSLELSKADESPAPEVPEVPELVACLSVSVLASTWSRTTVSC